MNVAPSGKVLPCHAAEVDPRARVLEREGPFAGRHLAPLAGLRRLPRHRLDARALPLLRAQGDRLGRLPLPGAGRCSAMRPLTDPACGKSPFHAKIEALATAEAASERGAQTMCIVGRALWRRGRSRRFRELETCVCRRRFRHAGRGRRHPPTLRPRLDKPLRRRRPTSRRSCSRPRNGTRRRSAAGLTYSYSKKAAAAFGPSFDDSVALSLEKGDDAKSRTVEVKMFTGEHVKAAGPFRSTEQNPVLLLALEANVEDLTHAWHAKPALPEERRPQGVARRRQDREDADRRRRQERARPRASRSSPTRTARRRPR